MPSYRLYEWIDQNAIIRDHGRGAMQIQIFYLSVPCLFLLAMTGTREAVPAFSAVPGFHPVFPVCLTTGLYSAVGLFEHLRARHLAFADVLIPLFKVSYAS